MRRVVLSILIIGTIFSNVQAQSGKIRIDADNTPLNQVFFTLRDKYGFQFSFNDRILSGYHLTMHREFNNKEKAITSLLSQFPLEYEKNGNVFVIFPSTSNISQQTENTRITGRVVESTTFEPLPFSYIIINNHQVQSDQNGDFTFLASADTTFNLQISHLGYFVYDTLLNSSLNKTFFLTPAVQQLGEVKVEGFTVEKATLIGNEAGKMKINHTIAPYLPGNGDNSVYTVLRLMPGVMASGEQSSDLSIWGSYESQTKIEFDGITVFGLNNQNDNIGVINPLMIKDIRVLKGGYEVNYDDRVGGLVQISGKNGNLYRPSFTFNINNTTLNTLAEVPVGKKSSLLAAYRQTYYNLYNPYNFNLFGGSQMGSSMEVNTGMHSSYNSMVDVLVIPDYKFRDANLKYSFRGNNKKILTVGLYGGGDKFQYNIDGLSGHQDLQNNLNETNFQSGGSAYYSKPWGNIFNSSVSLSYSTVRNDYEEVNSYLMGQHNMQHHQQDLKASFNEVRELNVDVKNRISLQNGVQLSAGIGYQENDLQLTSKMNDVNRISVSNNSGKFNFWLQGYLPIGKSLDVKPGLRAGYENITNRYFYDPRISASLRISKSVKINAASGRYHQFLSKMSFVDENQNYSWYWVNANGTTIPDMNAWHWVSGISYNKNDLLFSVEGYLKTTTGITRYYAGTDAISQGYYSGDNRSYGIDFYLKKEYKKNVAWISYTLSKTEENLSFDVPGIYHLAPQDQRHELKIAGIYNLKSFYFSANYVYGSGFEIMKNFSSANASIPRYSRFDAAVIYKFTWKKLDGNMGVSVLNVFNHPNIKYTNLKRIESGTNELLNVHSEAVPFTPTLFLKIRI